MLFAWQRGMGTFVVLENKQIKYLPIYGIYTSIYLGNFCYRYESFDLSGKVFISMEWAGHGDLLHYVRLKGPLKEPDAWQFFNEMCDAVEYLHKQNIVHRDLKCENVLLSKKNVIKIADFGFARTIGKEEKSATYCGSAAYAAPELLQGIPYKGPIADIWSLGVILYIMVCATMPFHDETIKILLKDQRGPLYISRNIEPDLSKDVKELMSCILSFDLSKRYINLQKIREHRWYKKYKGKQPVLLMCPHGCKLNHKNTSLSIKTINVN